MIVVTGDEETVGRTQLLSGADELWLTFLLVILVIHIYSLYYWINNSCEFFDWIFKYIFAYNNWIFVPAY